MVLKYRIQITLISLSIVTGMRCNVVAGLTPGTQASFGVFSAVQSVDWYDCNYLAAGGENGITGGVVSIYQFDQTTEQLVQPGSQLTVGDNILEVSWCQTSSFLTIGGANSSGQGMVQVYRLDPTNPYFLDLSGTQTPPFPMTSVDWCSSCSYIATGDTSGTIQVYYFDGSNLTTTFSPVNPSGNIIDSVKWCNNCHYLAAVDHISSLYIYTFDTTDGLQTATSYEGTSTYHDLAWCDSCNYIAAGGINNISGLAVIDIYKFDPRSTPSLLVKSTTISPISNLAVLSLKWCQGCDNLAVSAGDSITGENCWLFLYHFDEAAMSLSLTQSQPLNSNIENPFSLSWCSSCSYLAVGEFDNSQDEGIIQLYKSEFPVPPTPIASPVVYGHKICHRFPTQVDIINQLCWDAESTAVAYNIYADANLTILLATITNAPFCYSQHQVRNGTVSTYYVTAVDAYGHASIPAVVTI